MTARQRENGATRYYGDKDKNGAYVNRPVSMNIDREVILENGQPKFNGAVAAGWAESPEFDDYHDTNTLHTWEGAKLKIYLKTQDVIHSFFLPNLRLKQDALPGKTVPIWFEVKDPKDPKNLKANVEYAGKDGKPGQLVPINNRKLDEYEITCAELCGGFHYRMRGLLYVHKDKASYEAWLADAQKYQSNRGESVAAK